MMPKQSAWMIIVALVLVTGLALIAAILFALTNNAALIGLIGVIIGAVFGILGTVINAIWLEPLKREQENRDRNIRLRKAIYGEILDIVLIIGAGVKACENHCEQSDVDYLKSTEKHKHVDPARFSVYDSMKLDPVSFYQLDDALAIDDMYLHLKSTENRFEIFRTTPFDNLDKAKEECTLLLEQFKRSLGSISRTFQNNQVILEKISDGAIIEEWKDRLQELEKQFGPVARKEKKVAP
jgi:hypothetical protein